MAAPIEGAPVVTDPGAAGAVGEPSAVKPDVPPGGAPAETTVVPGPGSPGPGEPPVTPVAAPPGTGDVVPEEIKMPEGFDPYAFLMTRGVEATPEATAKALYEDRVRFGRQGGEIGQLRQDLAMLQRENVQLRTSQAGGAQGTEIQGDIYDRATEATQMAAGQRPDPETDSEGARRWDAQFSSSVTRITMEEYNEGAAAEWQGAQVAEEFQRRQVPPELQAEFSYNVNSLLGDNFPRSGLNWNLLDTLYRGFMYGTSVTEAFKAGARYRAKIATEVDAAGVPIHAGPGGAPGPSLTGEWTSESLVAAAKAGTITHEFFDKELTKLKAMGKA